MASLLKKNDADKIVFNVKPKNIRLGPSAVASDFVKQQLETSSEFVIADVVSNQSGVRELQKKNVEAQVEEMVLDRIKDIQEQAYSKAYELGLEEGRVKAFEETKENFATRLTAFDSFLKKIDTLTEKILKESEAQIIKLTYQVAEKIAMRNITQDQEPILQLLSGLVSEVQGANNIEVRLSPSDAQFIEELRQKGIKEIEILQRVKVEQSENIQMGGCIIKTQYGEIDATIEQRVKKAWQTLEAKLPNLKKDESAS